MSAKRKATQTTLSSRSDRLEPEPFVDASHPFEHDEQDDAENEPDTEWHDEFGHDLPLHDFPLYEINHTFIMVYFNY